MIKLLPVLFLLAGAGAGIGAGVYLRVGPAPGSDPAGSAQDDPTGKVADTMIQATDPPPGSEFVAFKNQFVIPVVTGNNVNALVVLSLAAETEQGTAEDIYRVEPKLRDVLLQVLFDHANMGGFAGRFTDGSTLDVLRRSMTEAAQSVFGEALRGIIITDLVRQDV
jgi:hypothetical protein